jgi:hypothetical protein
MCTEVWWEIYTFPTFMTARNENRCTVMAD